MPVSSHAERGLDFGRYRTYDWAPADALPRTDERLRSFFFQAEDGIRAFTVTGVQTCALPILAEYLKSRIQRPVVASTGVTALVLVIAFSLSWSTSRHGQWRMQRVDTRIRAIDWLQQRADRKSVVQGESVVPGARRIASGHIRL